MNRIGKSVVGIAPLRLPFRLSRWLLRSARRSSCARSSCGSIARGKKLATVGELADFGNIELSPDRKQIAAAVLNDQTGLRELWLSDAEGGHKSRLDMSTSPTRTG